jgi:hypothetical protein
VYAHVRAVRCEALHGIAFYAGIGTWGDMGHNTLDDPLRWNCAEAVAKEYRESHGPLK